jgi:hypothetical protein
MTKAIWFDMDGTIADLYAVEGWLAYLQAEDTTPYEQAKVMHNMAQLAKLLHSVQRKGYTIGIISWTSKRGTPEYNERVAEVKRAWLDKHLHSVVWDAINVVEYGTNKYSVCKGGILFDDEQGNRDAWQDEAHEPKDIIKILKKIIKEA